MYALLAQIAHFFPVPAAPAEQGGVARQLLERAEARAGLDPQDAQALRGAAFAYLRVVR
jgi:hypothetical protein